MSPYLTLNAGGPVTDVESRYLDGKWQMLAEQLRIPTAVADALLTALKQSMAEQHRAYHTLGHVLDLLRESDKHAMSDADRMQLELAIWYHDAVYDVFAQNNEHLSAVMATDQMRSYLTPEATQCLFDDIMSTAHHTDPRPDYPAQLLLDLDLAVFAAEPLTYKMYTQRVREEYRAVPDIMFNRGRMHALQQYLDREYIYHTPHFRECYEEAARLNVGAELRELSDTVTKVAA